MLIVCPVVLAAPVAAVDLVAPVVTVAVLVEVPGLVEVPAMAVREETVALVAPDVPLVTDVAVPGADALAVLLVVLTALVLPAVVADDCLTDAAEDELLVADDTLCAAVALVPDVLDANDEPALTDEPLSNTRPEVAWPNPVLLREP